MEIFVAIVDAGSISAAAERLDMAKSAVSRRLAELELRLDTVLLNRTTRRLSLTATGGEFFARCEDILQDVADAEAAAASTDAALAGTIRIAAPLSFGLDHLGPAINRFAELHPGVAPVIDFSDRQVDLVAEGFDVAVRIAKLGDSSLVARKLTTVRHVICASPDYWDRHGRPGEPADLRQHRGLRYTLAAKRNWAWTAPDGSRGSVTVPAEIAANNGKYLAEAAIAGHGVIRMPLFIVYRYIEAGELEPVLTDYRWNDLRAWAIYPRSRRLPARVRALVDFLAEEFSGTPYWEDCLTARTDA